MGRHRTSFSLKVVLSGLFFGFVVILHQTHLIRSLCGFAGSSRLSVASQYVRYQNTNLSGFQVRKADLDFLPQFKSPCWLEPYTDQNVYLKNLFMKTKIYPKKIHQLRSYKFLPEGGVPFEDLNICGKGFCRVRCLPYFMLIGVHKSGTTDICNRLTMHPQVFSSIRKEVYWWNQLRFDNMLGASLGDYADLFDMSLLQMIKYETKQSPTGSSHYPAVLGEFTAMTFFDMSHWRDDPENRQQSEPSVLTPYDIYKVNPKIKLLVSLRNPTTRLYSHYNLFTNGKGGGPEDFHRKVLGSIWWWERCTALLPQRSCVYGSPPELPPVYDKVGDPLMWWRTSLNYSGEIRTGMYILHAREWLKFFPKSNILFIHMEDYSANITQTYNEQIFTFLGLHQLSEQNIKTISDRKPSFQRNYLPMLSKTKVLLDQFYKPFNQKLADLLGDRKWLWGT